MPELPEVETIANDLDKELRGLKIVDFKVLNERTRRARPLLNLGENVFKQAVGGKKIRRVGRRAKMLVLDLGGNFILIHLKMTGQLVLKKAGDAFVAGGHPIPAISPPRRRRRVEAGGTGAGLGFVLPNKFTRASFRLSDGSELFFNDIRRFGWLKFLDRSGLDREFRSLGIEPLETGFSLEKFKEILKRKKNTAIKQALFDQKYLAGVGNIYADESLFAARIKPQRKTGSLKPAEIKRLWHAIPKILKLAIRHRGTTLSDYRDSRGRKGNFSRLLDVYGRAGEPCRVCGRPLEKGKLGGRGTHWCNFCQK